MRSAYDDNNLMDKVAAHKEYNSSVLVSSYSKLVGCLVLHKKKKIVTIDSDRLMREWKLEDPKANCCRSYLLQTRDD